MGTEPSERIKHFTVLKSLVHTNINLLLQKKEPFTKEEFSCLETLFEKYTAEKEISERIAIDSIDLEILKDPTLKTLDPSNSSEIKLLTGLEALKED
jgi:hypothetical protein